MATLHIGRRYGSGLRSHGKDTALRLSHGLGLHPGHDPHLGRAVYNSLQGVHVLLPQGGIFSMRPQPGPVSSLSSVRPKRIFQFRQKQKYGKLKSPKPNRNRIFCRTRLFRPNQLISAENCSFGRIFGLKWLFLSKFQVKM